MKKLTIAAAALLPLLNNAGCADFGKGKGARTRRFLSLMSALGHVWTAPWQELF
jgi:hypothetical protein